MEKIDTDYKRRIWKIEAKLVNMRKPWLSSFKGELQKSSRPEEGGVGVFHVHGSGWINHFSKWGLIDILTNLRRR